MPKPKLIETPEYLWILFEQYVLHEKTNPMKRTDYVGRDGLSVQTNLETPITFEGFECYLSDQGVIEDLGDYGKNKDDRYTEFVTTIKRIKGNCFVHNYKGAAVGLFNASIVAKKLGLIEKSDSTISQTITQITGMEVK